jgi:hypothetical protein
MRRARSSHWRSLRSPLKVLTFIPGRAFVLGLFLFGTAHGISLEDGRKFKPLKRHLSAHYGMIPDE